MSPSFDCGAGFRAEQKYLRYSILYELPRISSFSIVYWAESEIYPHPARSWSLKVPLSFTLPGNQLKPLSPLPLQIFQPQQPTSTENSYSFLPKLSLNQDTCDLILRNPRFVCFQLAMQFWKASLSWKQSTSQVIYDSTTSIRSFFLGLLLPTFLIFEIYAQRNEEAKALKLTNVRILGDWCCTT